MTRRRLLATVAGTIAWAMGRTAAGVGEPVSIQIDADRNAGSTRGDQALVERTLTEADRLGRVHSILVAHRGRPAVEHVFAGPGLDRPANIKSVAKTVLSALVGIAIEQGVVRDAHQPVIQLLGGVTPEGADPRLAIVTVGNLLSMQSGLERTSGANYGRWVTSNDWVRHALTRPFVDEPGGRMLYSTGNSHILSAALTRASGQSTRELALEWLGEPLGIVIPPWPRDPQGIYFGGNDMLLSPRALLRFGEMYRNDGRHEGVQVVPEPWIRDSWTPRGRSRFTNDQYGYGWFITELAGERVYYGWGFGGQVLYVIPGSAMTVVITSDPTPPGGGSGFLGRLHALVEVGFIPAFGGKPTVTRSPPSTAGT